MSKERREASEQHFRLYTGDSYRRYPLNNINSSLRSKVGSTVVKSMVRMTQAEYEALTDKVSTTLYIIIG